MVVVPHEERNINYDNFIGRLDLEMQRAKRYGRVLTICIISIDGAPEREQDLDKSFLREFTQVVLDQARTVDISVTISPEEFALILPETPFNNAMQAAERIKTAIGGHEFANKGKTKKITVSIGVAAFPEHSQDTAELARRAMQAAGKAGKQGGNQVCSAENV
jgi:diguanylate cyclase (GGDEF)-like protein